MRNRRWQFMVDAADLSRGVLNLPQGYQPTGKEELYDTYSVARLQLFQLHRKVITAHQQEIQRWVTILLEDVPTLESEAVADEA